MLDVFTLNFFFQMNSALLKYMPQLSCCCASSCILEQLESMRNGILLDVTKPGDVLRDCIFCSLCWAFSSWDQSRSNLKKCPFVQNTVGSRLQILSYCNMLFSRDWDTGVILLSCHFVSMEVFNNIMLLPWETKSYMSSQQCWSELQWRRLVLTPPFFLDKLN